MANKNFDFIAKESFLFLENDHYLNLSSCVEKNWGYELIYLNQTTAVKVSYEFQEAYIFIMLYKLVDGKLIYNPIEINAQTELHGYSLDDLLLIKNPSVIIKPAYLYGEESTYYNKENGLELFVNAFANNLKEYAKDVLNGNFKIFEALEIVVKERAKNNNGLT